MSGTLSPNVTGHYELGEPYNGYPAWYVHEEEWAIFVQAGVYTLADVLPGGPLSNYWTRPDDNSLGPYQPQGTATGVATVTAAP